MTKHLPPDLPPGLLPIGAILAGGRSRRYGEPKALAPIGGTPMIEWTRRALEPSVSRVVAIANTPELARMIDLPVRADSVKEMGPLAGIETALEWAVEEGAPGVVILACDLPLVPPEVVRMIVETFLGAGGGRIVLAESPGPLEVEPLCGCYPVGCLPVLRQKLNEAPAATERERSGGGGGLSVIEFARDVGFLRVPRATIGTVADPEVIFLNVNRKADRELAEAHLDGLMT